ncbi:MFS transporter [Oxalicibacterium faecigallinarum]|uniref:MFS transporter n=1 Tax=Oxalicibacterium faecigallinarum TaxID=573741 RepID=A0A8J3F2C2_9BURK|nr:MFS transporter [Oxalicibacterium faecigallinarum]GGI17824.1 MFS transporter [Oxalicibacterium faecigallinarum]
MADTSSWSPLQNKLFRGLWLATVASNIGTWMHDVGAGWMMTSLSPDPLMVALVQAATSLPMFLFALPSGVLADIVDRRKYLLFAQIWMLVTAAVLGVLAFGGLVTPEILLASTFMLGVGAAMAAPPFQAIVPELVGKQDLSAAVALNSLGVNISRAIGPALGGLILSFAGPPVVFMLNALSVLGVVMVLYAWKPVPRVQRLPAEHFFPAVRAGLRYVHAAPLLRVVLIRAVAFFVFGSAAWALLPLVARNQLGLGAGGYGALLACIGVGAVAGALLLPRLKKAFSTDVLALGASVLFAITMLALGTVQNAWLLGGILLFSGLAWIAMLSILNVGAQRSSAGWVKARALAVYLVVFFGSMAAGSTIWGKTAAQLGTSMALIIAALGMVLACATALRWKLNMSPDLDLTPSTHLHTHAPQIDAAHDAGPIRINVEYRVLPENATAFRQAIHEMRRVRRRGGAISWGVFEDMAEPGRYIETFVVESWLEHLRQHDRFTENDKAITTRVHALHSGPEAPRTEHLIAPS